MDGHRILEKIKENRKKLQLPALVLLAGILLMCLPTGSSEQTQTEQQTIVETAASDTLEEELEAILAKVKGAGKVEVLLTQASGAQTVYQTDDDTQTGTDTQSVRRDTVLVGSGSTQTGLVLQVNPPTYLGAVIVCQGADSASVKLAILDAVRSATGLSSDKISILKMK